jgi:hypothetical protein
MAPTRQARGLRHSRKQCVGATCPPPEPLRAAASRCEPLRNTRRGGTPEGVKHPKGWDFQGSSRHESQHFVRASILLAWSSGCKALPI